MLRTRGRQRWIGAGLMWLLCAASLGSGGAAHAWAQFGRRMDGKAVSSLGSPGTRAAVLFFVASDCPISNRTFPEMKRLRERFAAGSEVRVWFVYPNSMERAAEVEVHQRVFDGGGDAVLDPDGELVRLTGAKVTPEVAVLVPAARGGWHAVYTGRVDDRFVRLGEERPRPRRLFAEEAVEAVLAGRAVPEATGTPVGCGIVVRGTALPGAGVRR